MNKNKTCHNTYEKVINSCGGVDIVLESSSAEYRHSRQFSHTPVYPGLYPQRPIEAIELPSKSYLAPLFSYIAPLMSFKARRQLLEAPLRLSFTLCLLFHARSRTRPRLKSAGALVDGWGGRS